MQKLYSCTGEAGLEQLARIDNHQLFHYVYGETAVDRRERADEGTGIARAGHLEALCWEAAFRVCLRDCGVCCCGGVVSAVCKVGHMERAEITQ